MIKKPKRRSNAWTRRDFVESSLALPLAATVATVGGVLLLEPTPACGDDDEPAAPTPKQTEGPYFKPKTPERASLLEKDFKGRKLVVEGRVISTAKEPVAKALLDFWHCDADGKYDNDGFTFRGHLFTDSAGKYRLETILPGLYPGRTRHIHVKVQAPNKPVLTTQLYFPGDKQNAKDRIFNKKLLVKMDKKADRDVAHFQFVLDLTST